MKTKKGIIIGSIIGTVVVLAVVSLLFGMGLFKNFDAQSYVRAILEQNLHGNVKEATEVIDEKNEKELLQQYEDGVSSFVKNNITSGIEMDEELEAKYIALCKDIFKAMKFEVKEAQKMEGDKYHVPVEYQTADIFPKFVASVAEESARLMDKAEKGEYQGTQDEINAQMQEEFLNNSYELLKKSYEEVQYGEKKTETFVVEKQEGGLYTVDNNQIYEFILKIMGLDEIQD